MRTEITQTLEASGEDTAKGLAEEIGVEVKDIASELNAMLKDGLVEREKRKGNEYTYWLANPSNTRESFQAFSAQDAKEVIAEVAAESSTKSADSESPSAETNLIHELVRIQQEQIASLKDELKLAYRESQSAHAALAVYQKLIPTPLDKLRYMVIDGGEYFDDITAAKATAEGYLMAPEDGRGDHVIIALPISVAQRQINWSDPSSVIPE